MGILVIGPQCHLKVRKERLAAHGIILHRETIDSAALFDDANRLFKETNIPAHTRGDTMEYQRNHP